MLVLQPNRTLTFSTYTSSTYDILSCYSTFNNYAELPLICSLDIITINSCHAIGLPAGGSKLHVYN